MNGGIEWVTLDCPYCGERIETALDLSAGSHALIEDCQVCCRPIELNIETDAQGRLLQVASRRGDE